MSPARDARVYSCRSARSPRPACKQPPLPRAASKTRRLHGCQKHIRVVGHALGCVERPAVHHCRVAIQKMVAKLLKVVGARVPKDKMKRRRRDFRTRKAAIRELNILSSR